MSSSEITVNPEIEESWKKLLIHDFNSSNFVSLREFLREEKKSQEIYPPGSKIFTAFNETPLGQVKAVILGQDPYHGKGQAHGMCFSVPRGVKPPPSLMNIFKELKQDLGMNVPDHGCLENWARQGVLLLNATLTVRAGQAGSHQGKGWEVFTDSVISKLSKNKEGLVFFLWGRYAQAKEDLIDNSRHLVLKAAHPSPFSAYNGFFGCKHFSKCNEYLTDHGKEAINWNLD